MTGEYVCPECGYQSDDGKEWRSTFCQSWPDKCAGCEVHEDRLRCPECEREWTVEYAMNITGLDRKEAK